MTGPTVQTTHLRRWPADAAERSSSSLLASASGQSQTDFQKILALLIMSSSLSQQSSDSSGMGMGNMMAPIMFSLLEQLLATQVETTQASASTSEQATTNTSEQAASSSTTAAQSTEEQTNAAAASTVANNTTVEESADGSPKGKPVETDIITQYSRAGHVALDFGVSVGTQVHSTHAGKVVYAGWNNEGYGNLVIVENGPYRTYYAHLSEIPVSVDQEVGAGEVIGLSGNTGNSTGPHLHYEIRKDNVPIDPTNYTLY